MRNDAKSQECLYRHFYGYGMSICLRYAGNKSDAMEILNEAFLKIFTKIQKYDPEKSFRSWIRRILVNCCIDFHRNSQKTTSFVEPFMAETEEAELPLGHLAAEDILQLLAQLPDRYRLTFNLYEIEGYSHDEIGRMLGIPASTSRSNLTRAKKRLREMIEKNYAYATSSR